MLHESAVRNDWVQASGSKSLMLGILGTHVRGRGLMLFGAPVLLVGKLKGVSWVDWEGSVPSLQVGSQYIYPGYSVTHKHTSCFYRLTQTSPLFPFPAHSHKYFSQLRAAGVACFFSNDCFLRSHNHNYFFHFVICLLAFSQLSSIQTVQHWFCCAVTLNWTVHKDGRCSSISSHWTNMKPEISSI